MQNLKNYYYDKTYTVITVNLEESDTIATEVLCRGFPYPSWI